MCRVIFVNAVANEYLLFSDVYNMVMVNQPILLARVVRAHDISLNNGVLLELRTCTMYVAHSIPCGECVVIIVVCT